MLVAWGCACVVRTMMDRCLVGDAFRRSLGVMVGDGVEEVRCPRISLPPLSHLCAASVISDAILVLQAMAMAGVQHCESLGPGSAKATAVAQKMHRQGRLVRAFLPLGGC